MITYRLTEPTDFEILDALSDGRRNVALNLASELNQDRSYMNNRLRALADQDLIERIGPKSNSGLYKITPTGIAALHNRDLYAADRDEFTRTVREDAEAVRIEPPTVHGP